MSLKAHGWGCDMYCILSTNHRTAISYAIKGYHKNMQNSNYHLNHREPVS